MPNPDIQRNRKTLANASALVTLIDTLIKGDPKTKAELCEEVGVHYGAMVKWMRLLKSKKLIYIDHYDRDGNVGQFSAYWTWGSEADAPKPKPMTQKEYNKRSTQNKKARRLHTIMSVSLTLGANDGTTRSDAT